MSIAKQLDRLVEAGVAGLAGLDPAGLSTLARDLPDEPDGILAVHPALVPARDLATLLRRGERPGFVVVDLTDLEQFVPLPTVTVPDRPLYLLRAVDRGDDLRNLSPAEAGPVLTERGRTPLTISEGISWLLQEPDALQPNHCFMTIGSRRPRANGLDARTPAVWISGGTGRDGRDRAGAPKVGWCWAGNRHTWLGFASARTRSGG